MAIRPQAVPAFPGVRGLRPPARREIIAAIRRAGGGGGVPGPGPDPVGPAARVAMIGPADAIIGCSRVFDGQAQALEGPVATPAGDHAFVARVRPSGLPAAPGTIAAGVTDGGATAWRLELLSTGKFRLAAGGVELSTTGTYASNQTGAVAFDGSTGYLSHAAPIAPAFPFSFAFWFHAPAAAPACAVVGQYSATGGVHGNYAYLNGDDTISVYSDTRSGGYSYGGIGSTLPYTPDAWNLAVVVLESDASRRISVNGGAFASDAVSITGQEPASHALLGAYGVPGNLSGYFGGRLDRLGAWTRALTATEAGQLHASGSGLTYGGLDAGLLAGLASWHELDETSGTRADAHGAFDLAPSGGVTGAYGIEGEGEPDPPATVAWGWSGSEVSIALGSEAPAVAAAGAVPAAERVSAGALIASGALVAGSGFRGAVGTVASLPGRYATLAADRDAIEAARFARRRLDPGLRAAVGWWLSFGGEPAAPAYDHESDGPGLAPIVQASWPGAGPCLSLDGFAPDTGGRVVALRCAETGEEYEAPADGTDTEPDHDAIPDAITPRADSSLSRPIRAISGRTRFAIRAPGAFGRGSRAGVILSDRGDDLAGWDYEIDAESYQHLVRYDAGGAEARRVTSPGPAHGRRAITSATHEDVVASTSGSTFEVRRFDWLLDADHRWQVDDVIELVGGGAAWDGVRIAVTSSEDSSISVTSPDRTRPDPEGGAVVVGTGQWEGDGDPRPAYPWRHIPFGVDRAGDTVTFHGAGGLSWPVTIPGLETGPGGDGATRFGAAPGSGLASAGLVLDGPLEIWDGVPEGAAATALGVRAGCQITGRDAPGLAASRVDLAAVGLLDPRRLARYGIMIEVVDASGDVVATEAADHTGLPYGAADGWVATFSLGEPDLAADATYRVRVLLPDGPGEGAGIAWVGYAGTITRRAVTPANGCRKVYFSSTDPARSDSNPGTDPAAPKQTPLGVWLEARPRLFAYGKRGDVFAGFPGFGAAGGQLNPSDGTVPGRSSVGPITLAAYGSGDRPIVGVADETTGNAIPVGGGSRRAIVDSWEARSGNIFGGTIRIDEGIGSGGATAQGWLLRRIRSVDGGAYASVFAQHGGEARRECVFDQLELTSDPANVGYGAFLDRPWLGGAWVGFLDNHYVNSTGEHPWRIIDFHGGSLRAWRLRTAGGETGYMTWGHRQLRGRINISGIPHSPYRRLNLSGWGGPSHVGDFSLRYAHAAGLSLTTEWATDLYMVSCVAHTESMGSPGAASMVPSYQDNRRATAAYSHATGGLGGFTELIASGTSAPGSRGGLAAPAVAAVAGGEAGLVGVSAAVPATGGAGVDAPWLELWREPAGGGIAVKVAGSGRPRAIDDPGPGSWRYFYRAVDATLATADGIPSDAVEVVA